MKRMFDILTVVLAMPGVLLVVLIVAITVVIMDGRPIFFHQRRAGLKGRIFELIKFRTMHDGVITRLGKFLRASSLDEIPELWNVLKGDMSLVGPRPLLPEYLSRYSPRQMRRHDVLPGITGWAQVHGRNSLSWDEKFELDVWYVEHSSFILDLKILLLTIGTVFGARGIAHEGSDSMTEFIGNGGTENA